MILRSMACLAFVVAFSSQTISANDSLRREVEAAVRGYWDTPWREDLSGQEKYDEQVRLAQRLCDLGKEHKQDKLVARGLARLALADTHWFWRRSLEDGKWEENLAEAETLCGTGSSVARAEVLGIRGHINGRREGKPWGPVTDLTEAIGMATRLREDELCCWLHTYLARFHLDVRDTELMHKYGGHLAVEAAHLSLEIAEASDLNSDAPLKEALKWVFHCRDPHFGGEVLAKTPGERSAGVEPYLTRLLEMKVPPRLIGAVRLPQESSESFEERLRKMVEDHETAKDTPSILLRAMARFNLGLFAMRAGRNEEALSHCQTTCDELHNATSTVPKFRYARALITARRKLREESSAKKGAKSKLPVKTPAERLKEYAADRRAKQQEYSELAASAAFQWQNELARRKFVDDSIASERRHGQIQLWGSILAATVIIGLLVWRYRLKTVSLRRLNEEMVARQQEQELREGLQEQVAASQRLESIGTFSSGVAHDVNNALAVVKGFTEIAMLNEGAEEREASLKHVLDASDLAANTTRDLLLFARQDASEPKPIRLGPLVQDAVGFMKRVTKASVNLSCIIADDSTFVCLADHSKLTQVLVNLIQNASDAIENGGDVRVALRVDSKQPARARIVIEDTGRGIPDKDLSRVCEPFFTTKGRGKGTGLGLAVAHGIIETHHGTLDIQSTSLGTVVTVELPLIPDLDQSDEVRRSETVAGNERLILVAEDDKLVRRLIHSLLAEQGFRPIVCRDGNEFMDHYERHAGEVAAAILDCDLPGKSGQDCLECIRLADANLPVLMISGWTRTIDGEYFLAKPFGNAELNDALWALLDNDQVYA